MIEVSDEQFERLIAEAMDELPREHMRAVKNVAIVYDDEPSAKQREELKLACHQTLYGLYEGVPLPQRAGQTGFSPDKITLFKGPLTRQADTLQELKALAKHTLWHEVAHYFGLNHAQIHHLENR